MQTAADLRPVTVLLVDDEPAVRYVSTLVLRQSGFAVLAAASPNQALEMVAAHAGAIDLLVADAELPGMSGDDLGRKLVAARPRMRRLLMSGYSEDYLVHSGQIEPGTPFLPKPFPLRALVEKARETLDG
jgi:two-component system cell cycle sensor histidine kinase/response regulator CckA